MARTVTIKPIQTSNFDMSSASGRSGPSSPATTSPKTFSHHPQSYRRPRHPPPSIPLPPTPTAAVLESIGEDEPATPKSPSYSGFPSTFRSFDSPARRTFDSPPTKLNSPRRLSNSSSTTTMTSSSTPSSMYYSRESIRSEMFSTASSSSSSSSSSWGGSGSSRTSLGSQSLVRSRKSEEIFAALPGEALELVMEMLKRSHLRKGSDSCATCWKRDLCSVSLVSRKWSKFARISLYQDIQLIGSDSAAQKKKFKMIQGTRLLMLRQTLRSNNHLASLVRSIKVPRSDPTVKGNTSKTLEQYDDLVATLVMACPNLERLSGPIIGYDHSFKKILHALSTRTQLKEMHWLMEPLPTQPQGRKSSTTSLSRINSGLTLSPKADTSSNNNNNNNNPNNPVELDQSTSFLQHHRNWSNLTTLSIHCLPGSSMAPDNLITRMLTMLPSLQHLHVCNLPPNAFNDTTLLTLPPLQTLSLTHITGISSSGLSSFATCSASQPLRRLHLRHTPLDSLPALARILSNLTSLTSFSLAQAFPPLMPEADTFALWMMPYLASQSLAKLHWDITSHRDCATMADDILAKSISAGGFPHLTLLRTPNDPEAIFQDLCRPVESISLLTDRFTDDTPSSTTSPVDIVPPSPVRSVFRSQKHQPQQAVPPSPTTGSLKINCHPPPCTDLRLARLAAQSRLERARARPRFTVNVTAEDGRPVDRFRMAGYIGTVGSRIIYHLLPDVGSVDEKGGVVDVRDLAGDAGETLSIGREGCTGVWNRAEGGMVADKKEKERWWHTERGRWTRIELV